MGGWGRRKKDGQRYPKDRRRKSGISADDVSDPRNPRNHTQPSSYDDEWRRKELEEFAKWKNEEFKKREKKLKKEKKEQRIQNFFNQKLDLGHAKGFLIKATPVLVQLDPNLSAIYTGYKVGKYGYCFMKKVNQDYEISGDFDESLKTVAKKEVEQKITSRLKSLPKEKGSKYAANKIWTYAKENFTEKEINPKWDSFGENALAKTFDEVGGTFL